jgi:hypothetical protein
MDSKLFRLPTGPNFYESIQSARPVDVTEIARGQIRPASDSRFPGYPAQMEDGRMVTDYSSHCSQNVPVGKQFPTKAFMQKRAEEIIGLSRRISAKRMGADFMFDSSVVPPFAGTVSCTRSECSREAGPAGGIGTGRHEPVPELFGTYTIPYTEPPAARVSYTARYEGGRNSIRGVDGPASY